jgi:hypothetical protein
MHQKLPIVLGSESLLTILRKVVSELNLIEQVRILARVIFNGGGGIPPPRSMKIFYPTPSPPPMSNYQGSKLEINF